MNSCFPSWLQLPLGEEPGLDLSLPAVDGISKIPAEQLFSFVALGKVLNPSDPSFHLADEDNGKQQEDALYFVTKNIKRQNVN